MKILFEMSSDYIFNPLNRGEIMLGVEKHNAIYLK